MYLKVIKLDEFYNDYLEVLRQRINTCKERLEQASTNLSIIKRYIDNTLEKNSEIRATYFDTTAKGKIEIFKVLFEIKNKLYAHNIKLTSYKMDEDSLLKINEACKKYVIAKLDKRALELQLQDLTECNISMFAYNKLSDYYNKNCVLALLNGSTIKFANNQGTLSVNVVPSNSKRSVVDWGKSNKYKQVLLDTNRIPYNKKDHEEAIKNNVEYKGEEWLIYNHNPFMFRVIWSKNKKIENIRTYSFAAADTSVDKRTVDEIMEIIKSPQELLDMNFSFIRKLYLIDKLVPNYKRLFKLQKRG